MRIWLRRSALMVPVSVAISVAFPQRAEDRQSDRHEPARLPNGKLQSEEILKAEHEQNLRDASQLIETAEELKQELEKNDRHVLSVSTLKKTDEIEKLVKKIRSRLRHI